MGIYESVFWLGIDVVFSHCRIFHGWSTRDTRGNESSPELCDRVRDLTGGYRRSWNRHTEDDGGEYTA